MKRVRLHSLIIFNAALLGILGSIPVWAQAPSGLTATKATSSEVDLSWAGSASSYTVQRGVLGASLSTIATVATASYKDAQIDAYTTYVYQVTANSANSNQVTVGPPPVGFQVAAATPAQVDPSSYGYGISMTLDGNGDPAFAFVFNDPNQDSNPTDTELLFRSWNRAQYKWNSLITVDTVGDITSSSHPTGSLAYDPSTGTFALASEVATADADLVRLYVSSDGGAHWSTKTTYGSAAASSWAPSIALRAGKIYLAYELDQTGINYINGTLSSGASSWTTAIAPQPSGTALAGSGGPSAPSLALDSTGNPGIAYWVQDTTQDYNLILLYWHPSSAPVRVTDTQNNNGDTEAKLRFFGTNPRIAFYGFRNDSVQDDAGIHFVRSDNGGATWLSPVLIPPDIGASTDHPLDLALNSQGAGAIAFEQNSSNGMHTCGFPKLALSSDLSTWNTCSPGGVSLASTTKTFDPVPNSLALNYGGNDKLYVMWQDNESSPTGNGVLLWREPPVSQGTGPDLRSVQDAVNNLTQIVPGSWVSLYGSNFSDITTDWSQEDFSNGLPTSLGGVQVTFNGKSAAVYYVKPTQINAQVPSDLSGTATVQVMHNGATSQTVTVPVVNHSAGLFSYSQDYVTFFPSARFNANAYEIVGDPAIFGSAVQKAKPGDSVQLYANGLAPSAAGMVSPPNAFSDPVTVTVGATAVQADFAGLVAPGLFQVNFTVPNLAPGNYPITITADGSTSQGHVVLVVGN